MVPNIVASWLLSRFAIVANFSKLFRAPAMFGRFTIVARILGRPIFLKNGISEANSYRYCKYYKYYKRFQTKIRVLIRFQLSPIEILTWVQIFFLGNNLFAPNLYCLGGAHTNQDETLCKSSPSQTTVSQRILRLILPYVAPGLIVDYHCSGGKKESFDFQDNQWWYQWNPGLIGSWLNLSPHPKWSKPIHWQTRCFFRKPFSLMGKQTRFPVDLRNPVKSIIGYS